MITNDSAQNVNKVLAHVQLPSVGEEVTLAEGRTSSDADVHQFDNFTDTSTDRFDVIEVCSPEDNKKRKVTRDCSGTYVENLKYRRTTFCRRVKTLLDSAETISSQTGAEIKITIYNPDNNKTTHFCTSNLQQVLDAGNNIQPLASTENHPTVSPGRALFKEFYLPVTIDTQYKNSSNSSFIYTTSLNNITSQKNQTTRLITNIQKSTKSTKRKINA